MSVIPSLPGYIFTEKLGKGSYATVYKAYRNVEKREVVAIKCVLKSSLTKSSVENLITEISILKKIKHENIVEFKEFQVEKREVVAIKCVLKSSLTKSSVENLITEISILKKIKHENIVEFKDFQWDNTYIYLILEYCSGGDLSHFIRSKKRLPESFAQRFLQQLAKALQCLRSHNIAHMDLKPQNILLSSVKHPVLKLGDFGLAQYLHSDSEASSLRGSPLYMAPEILLKHHYDASVDLWSVGIILYECLFGQAPFSSHTFSELAEKIKCSNPIQIPYGAQVSDKCRELILGLLQRNPSKRMTFDEFFNHPFIDLEHMATEESYAKGVNLVQQAVAADSEEKYEKAVQLYGQALDYLVPHILNERSELKRRELRKKLLEYVSRAEELKKAFTNRKNISKAASSSSRSEKQASDLDALIAARPDLRKAIFLAKQADALVNDGSYDDASEIYKTALEIMVACISEEPSGPDKDLIYSEVNKWMQKAEDLKDYLSILKQQKRIARMNSLNETIHFNATSENIGSRRKKKVDRGKCLKAFSKK